MSRMLGKLIVFSVLLASSVTAVANDGKKDGDGKDGDKPGSTRIAQAISWDEFKARCANPEQFDVQRAPQNIRVQCTDVQREFVLGTPGDVSLPGTRKVGTTVFSDKFVVNAAETEFVNLSKNGSCMRFKEVEKKITIERSLSCAEILSVKGTIQDVCVGATDIAKSANPKLIEVLDTGRAIDTCGGSTSIHEPSKGPGKDDSHK